MTGSPALCTRSVGEPPALGALLLLGVALLIALGFEFVNGFHDTAVTTVISTHSLPPAPAARRNGVFTKIKKYLELNGCAKAAILNCAA